LKTSDIISVNRLRECSGKIGDLDAKKAEAQALESRLAELRSRLDEAQQIIRNLAELEIKLNSLPMRRSL